MDKAGNTNTSVTYRFNITNIAPSIVLLTPLNGTWTYATGANFTYNVSEMDQPVFDTTKNYTAMAVYLDNTNTQTPYYRTWSGTAWSGATVMASSGSPLRWIKLATSTSFFRPREKIAVTLSNDGYLDAYVWNGSAWNLTSNIMSVGATMNAYRAYDIEYESQSGRALLVASKNSTLATQDWQYAIWNGTAWSAPVNMQDPTFAAHVNIGYMRLARDPSSNNLALAYIDTTNTAARATLWNGASWSNPVNITTAITSTAVEDVGVGYEQQSSHVLAVAGNGNNVSYIVYNGSAWSSPSLVDISPGVTQPTAWLSLKADPINNNMMLIGVDTSLALSAAQWSNGTWSGATLIDAGADTAASRPADYDWVPNSTQGLLVWGTAAGSLARRPYTGSTWGTQVNTGAGANTHPWVRLIRNPHTVGDMSILGAMEEATNDRLGGVTWNANTSTFTLAFTQFSTNEGQSTYQGFDLAYDVLPQYSSLTPIYSFANCSLYLDGQYNQTNSSKIWLEYPANFTVTNLSEGVHTWYVNCTDSDGLWNVSTTRTLTVDRTSPFINLTQPATNTTWSIFSLNFSFTPMDALSPNETCSLALDGLVNISSINTTNNTNTTRQISNLNNSAHYWNVTCTDFAGNTNTSATWNFTIYAPPIVKLVSPASGNFTNAINTTLIYNVTGPSGIANCSLFLNGVFNTTNQTAVSNNNLNNFTLLNVSEGLYNWSVNCTDPAGLSGAAGPYNITIARTPPFINLTLPANNGFVRNSLVTYNWTAYDTWAPSMQCYANRSGSIDGPNHVTGNVGVTSGVPASVQQASVPDGQNWWTVTCTDNAGNTNTSVTWTYNVSALPNVTLLSPGTNSWLNTSNLSLIYYPSTSAANSIVNCTLYINGVFNQTNSSINKNQNNTFWLTNVSDAKYNWSVGCTDAGNGAANSTTWTFFEDHAPPFINLSVPNNTAVVSNNTVTFTYTPVDDMASALVCNLTVNTTTNGTVYDPNKNVNNNTAQSEVVPLHGNNASYKWNVTCRDQAFNYNASADVEL